MAQGGHCTVVCVCDYLGVELLVAYRTNLLTHRYWRSDMYMCRLLVLREEVCAQGLDALAKYPWRLILGSRINGRHPRAYGDGPQPTF